MNQKVLNSEPIGRYGFIEKEKDGRTIRATGYYIQDALMYFNDDGECTTSYSDTGIVILLPGSDVSDDALACHDQHLSKYVSDGKITRMIAFQSRHAAAQFVLGGSGQVRDWQGLE